MVFEKEYIMRRSSAEWIARNGCALRWCHRGVPSRMRKLWNSEWTAQFCVWKTGKDSSEACAIACQNCAVYSVFPSGMTSHSKIIQFNWKCIGRFINSHQKHTVVSIKSIWCHRTHTCWQFITGKTVKNWRQQAKLLQPAPLKKCWLQVWMIKTAISSNSMHTRGSHTHQVFYENNTACVYTQSCMHNMSVNTRI